MPDTQDAEYVAQARLTIVPLSLRAANDFVARLHRHHQPARGHKFSVGVEAGGVLVGVAIAGRPVARHYDDGLTLEVNRTCTDGTEPTVVADEQDCQCARCGSSMGWQHCYDRSPNA